MDAFTSLSERAKVMIVGRHAVCAYTLDWADSIRRKYFSMESGIMKDLKGSIQADMLYVHPELDHGGGTEAVGEAH